MSLGRQPATVDPELAAELHGSPWMYEWELAPGVVAPAFNQSLKEVHSTRAELIEGPVREALQRAGPRPVAIDLACNEGWFSHRLLEWGAARVIGVDIRESNIRRAELVRDHFAIPEERLEFRCADVFQLDPDELGEFDVVLMLGLVYHLENPGGAIRLARALTRDLCAIESQLTRQNRPIVHGFGSPYVLLLAAPSFAALRETDADSNPLASAKGLVSLIPNRAALEQLADAAGFAELEWAVASPHHELQYVQGDRGILFGRAREATPAPVAEVSDPRVDVGPRDGRAADSFAETIRALLPPAAAERRKRALDLGAGLGRPLAGLGFEVEVRDVTGEPELPFDEGTFALISAYAAFSHLPNGWAEWLCELHRVLADEGLLVASFLGQGAARDEPLIPVWEESATGMLVLRLPGEAEGGGPTVYHSAWWIREHWGRAFEPLRIQREGLHPGPGAGEGVVLMRKRPGTASPQDLERVEAEDPREVAAWRTQLAAMEREDAGRMAERSEELQTLEVEVEGARRSLELGRKAVESERAAVREKEAEIQRLASDEDE